MYTQLPRRFRKEVKEGRKGQTEEKGKKLKIKAQLYLYLKFNNSSNLHIQPETDNRFLEIEYIQNKMHVTPWLIHVNA